MAASLIEDPRVHLGSAAPPGAPLLGGVTHLPSLRGSPNPDAQGSTGEVTGFDTATTPSRDSRSGSTHEQGVKTLHGRHRGPPPGHPGGLSHGHGHKLRR